MGKRRGRRRRKAWGSNSRPFPVSLNCLFVALACCDFLYPVLVLAFVVFVRQSLRMNPVHVFLIFSCIFLRSVIHSLTLSRHPSLSQFAKAYLYSPCLPAKARKRDVLTCQRLASRTSRREKGVWSMSVRDHLRRLRGRPYVLPRIKDLRCFLLGGKCESAFSFFFFSMMFVHVYTRSTSKIHCLGFFSEGRGVGGAHSYFSLSRYHVSKFGNRPRRIPTWEELEG